MTMGDYFSAPQYSLNIKWSHAFTTIQIKNQQSFKVFIGISENK